MEIRGLQIAGYSAIKAGLRGQTLPLATEITGSDHGNPLFERYFRAFKAGF